MDIKSKIVDKKVSATSYLVEISIRDYLALAKEILRKNQFQRKRVRGSKSVYSLLKTDILTGCVMPPIVLAYTKPEGTLEAKKENALVEDTESFVLLDGLQRTYTLIDLENETAKDPKEQKDFLDGIIRCEIYEGIDRLGILYRMLTLNTGQTAMSLRHQIEIMYLDWIDEGIGDIRLIREVEGGRARQASEYNFRDMIDGFNSYLERSESPLDRGDLLDNISSLENLAKENQSKDIFTSYVIAWDLFVKKIDGFSMAYPLDDTEGEEDVDDSPNRLWATNGMQAFKRPQAMCGFGAAIGLLRDDDPDFSFDNLPIEKIVVGAESDDFMVLMNDSIRLINERAKRIGNAQRLYFRQLFKMLFWKDSGCYLNLSKSADEAFKSSVKIGI